MVRLLAFLCCLALPAQAEEIVSDLSRDEVSINATFNGSDILVFGAVRRDAPEPDGRLGVIITVAGPKEDITVRKKDRKFGIWVNTEEAEIVEVPSFYAVATSAPLARVLSDGADASEGITFGQVVHGIAGEDVNAAAFEEALIRIKSDQSKFQLKEGDVSLSRGTLFSTSIELPANLTEGYYRTRILLTRDGEVVDRYETAIPVQKVGIERWLYNLARQMPFWYGIMSLAIAISAGWLASAVFSLARR